MQLRPKVGLSSVAKHFPSNAQVLNINYPFISKTEPLFEGCEYYGLVEEWGLHSCPISTNAYAHEGAFVLTIFQFPRRLKNTQRVIVIVYLITEFDDVD